jgi:hypothetical protein
MQFVFRTLTAQNVAATRVLEVGSYNVNGTVREYVTSLGPEVYLGVDAAEGPDVDQVVNCEQLVRTVGKDWDVVVSTEMLEHVQDWWTCLSQLVYAVAPGGLLLVTTRGPGFPYHPYPTDNWRFTVELLADALDRMMLTRVVCESDPEAPGVFLLARKPRDWCLTPRQLAMNLEGLHAQAMTG